MTVLYEVPTTVSEPESPAMCRTQVYYDRDVQLLLCLEEKRCRYKKYYNKMVICECPTDGIQDSSE
jgi:hypothetical protein